jgi:hypothetical protein
MGHLDETKSGTAELGIEHATASTAVVISGRGLPLLTAVCNSAQTLSGEMRFSGVRAIVLRNA